MRKIAFSLAAAFLATTGNGAAQIGPLDKISVGGVGPVRFGMTLAQAAAAGAPLAADAHTAATCFNAHSAGEPGLSFLIRNGQIVRADVMKPSRLKTIEGFKLGNKEIDVVSFYAATSGGASDVPLSDSSDITLVASPEFSKGTIPRLVYEITDKAGVFAIHAGAVSRDLRGC
jgi:hypothetical protein